MSAGDDILCDALDALVSAGIPRAQVAPIIREIRHRWAGETVYIPARCPDREAAIQAALAAGLPPEAIARRVGVSTATIRRRRARWLA